MTKVTYEGQSKYAQVAIDTGLKYLKDEHTSLYNGTTIVCDMSDGTSFHVITYNRPKKGIRVLCYEYPMTKGGCDDTD
jgi:hypothetical protein